MTVATMSAPKKSSSESYHEEAPQVTRLAAYASPDTKTSVFQLLNTAIPFALVWYAMLKSLAVSYWLTLLLAVPASLLVVRLFIFQHDAGHGSFFLSHRANDWVGFWIGVLTLSPYKYWRKTHAIHHATSGNLDKRGQGDIDTLTVKEYLSLSPWGRRKYRAYRHPLTMFLVGPLYQFVFKHRYPFNIPFGWKREWASVHLTNLALAAVLLLAWATIGLKSFLLVQGPIVLLSSSAGAWLFYVQHQYANTYWERQEKWDYFDASMKGSSYYVLPKVLQWFTGSIGIHHIHHYNSRIPNYKLQKCFDENPDFQNVTRLTLRSSLASIRLALWDEDAKRLVSFRSAMG